MCSNKMDYFKGIVCLIIICVVNVVAGYRSTDLAKLSGGGINTVGGGYRADPEIYMNVSQLITSKGYPCEEYELTTDDGYVLGIQRIPHGYNAHRHVSNPRPVVLLQHGLLSSASDWVDNLVNESLGFVLADAGFDVWLGNSRGNTYSLKHTSLTPDDEAFWEFTWDEMASYDLPATIDKVLKVTGQTSLVYIGFSQGTQIAFAELSHNKKLASKIKLFVALAPVAYIGNMKSPLRLLAPFANDIDLLLSVFGVKDFLPSDAITRWLARYLCGYKIPDILCENILFVFGGYDFQNMNATRVPVYVSHTPAGTSTRNIIHYAQSIQSGKFQKFDFGRDGNQKRYGQSTPPEYDPSNIAVPVALYSGTADWLAVPRDVVTLKGKLKTLVRRKIISQWAHLDFTWAVNGPQACYDDVIQLIRLHNNEV